MNLFLKWEKNVGGALNRVLRTLELQAEFKKTFCGAQNYLVKLSYQERSIF